MVFFASSPFYRFDGSVTIGVICRRRPKQGGKVAQGGKKNRNLIELCAAERLARPRLSEKGSLQIKI